MVWCVLRCNTMKHSYFSLKHHHTHIFISRIRATPFQKEFSNSKRCLFRPLRSRQTEWDHCNFNGLQVWFNIVQNNVFQHKKIQNTDQSSYTEMCMCKMNHVSHMQYRSKAKWLSPLKHFRVREFIRKGNVSIRIKSFILNSSEAHLVSCGTSAAFICWQDGGHWERGSWTWPSSRAALGILPAGVMSYDWTASRISF